MSTVAIIKGRGRYQNICSALELLGPEAVLGGSHLIKPNFVSIENQLASTHREALRALLDVIRRHSDAPITVGEGTALYDTFDGFRNFGFDTLVEGYPGVGFGDLNRDRYETVTLYDEDLVPLPFRVARTVLESDHRISLSVPKTHDTATVTLGLKNLAVGSLIRDMEKGLFTLVGMVADRVLNHVPSLIKPFLSFQGLSRLGITRISSSDKVRLHQGYLNMHLFLYQLARIIPPHLSVLDGFFAMEGDGPVSGDPVAWDLAVAGTDPVAVDSVAAHLMGFEPESIGYLHFCGKAGLGETDIDHIRIVGAQLDECRRTFRPHRSYAAQLKWKDEAETAFERLQEILESGEAKSGDLHVDPTSFL